jgi:hypothetical protein
MELEAPQLHRAGTISGFCESAARSSTSEMQVSRNCVPRGCHAIGSDFVLDDWRSNRDN